jgi:hypothetical protein
LRLRLLTFDNDIVGPAPSKPKLTNITKRCLRFGEPLTSPATPRVGLATYMPQTLPEVTVTVALATQIVKAARLHAKALNKGQRGTGNKTKVT